MPKSGQQTATILIQDLVTSLFSSMDSLRTNEEGTECPLTPSEATRNFLSRPDTKQLLLTLHCIFPDQLLPALDLLERGRISIYFREEPEAGTGDLAGTWRHEPSCYYVEASSQRTNRFSQVSASRSFYEIRARAWNCSCPAFTFSTLEGELTNRTSPESSDGGEKTTEAVGASLIYGGLAGGDNTVPICKHLLACLLANSNRLLAMCVKHVAMTEHELAGWAAGWTT